LEVEACLQAVDFIEEQVVKNKAKNLSLDLFVS
jgi:hypothetical protein